jgi:ABC-type multidrug transport system fused ATPase/permease subunit
MSRLREKKTIIAIAQRITALRHCDRIYRIENGNIVSVETYAGAMSSILQ